MNKLPWLSVVLVAVSVGSANAKVIYDEAIVQDEQITASNVHMPPLSGFTNADLALQTNSRIDWKDMPAGTKCGDYVMSQNSVRVNVLCQGHNVRYGCPSGFAQQNFGFFEAGGGQRMYLWCSKL